MTRLLLLLFLCISFYQVEAQASYDTKIAFQLLNEKNEPIHLEQFKEEYQLVDVFGNIIPNEDLQQCLYYDEATDYFILTITTIGPRFSFALYHNNTSMIVYLPFNNEDIQYAVSFKFRPGKYLFDFSLKNKEKLQFDSNIPYFLIPKLNWRKLNRKLRNSSYSNDDTYTVAKD